MKNNIDTFIENSFKSLNEISQPSKEQKETILSKVLFEARTESDSKRTNFKDVFLFYPWRFALGASAIQAIVFTVIFGSKYTNLVFQFLGR